eukprot:EG_transcript_21031
MLFDGQPAENYRRFVLILDDHVSEWEETGNVVSMLPFRHDLDDPPGYVAGAEGEGGDLGRAVLQAWVALNTGRELPLIQRQWSVPLPGPKAAPLAVVEVVEDGGDPGGAAAAA